MKIGEVTKNSQEVIRVSLQDYQGTDVIDVRTYWQNADGNWIPTKKGISLTHYVIEDVIKLLQKAFKKMEAQAESREYNSISSNELLKIIKRL